MMRHRRLSGLLALTGMLAVSSNALRAQNADVAVVKPADGQMDGRRIPIYTNAWRSFRVRPDGTRRVLAVWYDTVTVTERDGREILRRVQTIVRDDGTTNVLVNEADRINLTPYVTTAARANAEAFIDLRFDGRRVSGRHLLVPHNGTPADQVPAELTVELPEPVYDWRWWGLLVAALPLEKGYAARFLAYVSEPPVESLLIWISARVVGEGAVGGVQCWVVEVDAGVPWTLWIAKSGELAPVQRIRIEQPDGDILSWEPLEMTGPS